MESRWQRQEVPDVDGIVTASGHIFAVDSNGIKETGRLPENVRWADLDIMASQTILDGNFRIVCGESSGHGSIGVVVMEDTKTQLPVWSMVSYESNPFDQIEVKAGYILVLSTSGTVFRFRPLLEEVNLSIP